MLSLRVHYPAGVIPGRKYTVIGFKPGAQLSEVIEEIAKSNGVDLDVDQHTIYIPGSKGSPGKWMKPEDTLSGLGLVENANVHLRRVHIFATTYFVLGSKAEDVLITSILYNVFDPVPSLLSFTLRKAKLEIANAKLYTKGGKPFKDTCLAEQSIRPENTQFVIRDSTSWFKQSLLEEAEERSAARAVAATQKKPAINFQASAKSFSNPDKAGFVELRVVEKKKAKFERKWLVLTTDNKDKFLFCYKTPNDPKPMHIFPLVISSLEMLEEKGKKLNGLFDICAADESVLTFKLENEGELEAWVKALHGDGVDSLPIKDVSTGQRRNTQPPKQTENKVFGRPLAECVKVADGTEIPSIVERSIKYIEENALEAVGIFRLSGSALQIEKYKNMFDAGEEVDLASEPDPHAVAGLLKLWFRELPEPVMTFDLYPYFICCAESVNFGAARELQLLYLRYLLSLLEPVNYTLLKRLMVFLKEVSRHSEVNKMALHNLATVFGPNLLTKKNVNMLEMVEDTPQINSIVNTLIKEYEHIFEDKIPDLKDVNNMAAKALYEYTPQGDHEMALKVNDLVYVIHQNNTTGWWIGHSCGNFGKFPGSYVQVISDDQRARAARKEKFMEDLANVKSGLSAQKAEQAKLVSKKRALEEEVQALEAECARARASSALLNAKMKEAFPNVDDVLNRLDSLSTDMSKYQQSRENTQYIKGQLMQGIETISKLLASDPKMKKKKVDKTNDQLSKLLQTTPGKFISDDMARKSAAEFTDLILVSAKDLKLTLQQVNEVQGE